MHFYSILWNRSSTIRCSVLRVLNRLDKTYQVTVLFEDFAFVVGGIANEIFDIALHNFPDSLAGLVLDQTSIRDRKAIKVCKTGDGVLGLIGSSLGGLRKGFNVRKAVRRSLLHVLNRLDTAYQITIVFDFTFVVW